MSKFRYAAGSVPDTWAACSAGYHTMIHTTPHHSGQDLGLTRTLPPIMGLGKMAAWECDGISAVRHTHIHIPIHIHIHIHTCAQGASSCSVACARTRAWAKLPDIPSSSPENNANTSLFLTVPGFPVGRRKQSTHSLRTSTSPQIQVSTTGTGTST